jgi:hypothetical protein
MDSMSWIRDEEERDLFFIQEGLRDMAKLTIGTIVRVKPHTGVDDEKMYDGQIGKITDINPLADDGDAFGVSFPSAEETLETVGHEHIIYFWASELQILSEGDKGQ